MKRFLATLILLVPAIAFAQPMPETITVSGTGRATVTPDRFSFTVGVQTVSQTVDQAVNENNTKTAAVIAALKKAGATDQDIRTSNFTIWPQQDYQQGQIPRILGYQVSNSITVRRTNIGEAGRLLGVAVNSGVNTASGIQFDVSDPTKGREQGMRAAFDDARSKAALLAQAAGRTLGRALSISDVSGAPMPPPRPMAMAMKAAAVSDVPVEAGTQENAYTITVVFELR